MGQVKHAKGLKIASIALGIVVALLIIATIITVFFIPVGSTYNALRCGTDFDCRDVDLASVDINYLQNMADILAIATGVGLVILVILIIIQAQNTKLRGPGGRDYMQMKKPEVSDENTPLTKEEDEPKK